jgi:hypothetical protein
MNKTLILLPYFTNLMTFAVNAELDAFAQS